MKINLCIDCNKNIDRHRKNDPMWVMDSWFQIPSGVFDYEAGYEGVE
jgi:hypothetical protein